VGWIEDIVGFCSGTAQLIPASVEELSLISRMVPDDDPNLRKDAPEGLPRKYLFD